MAPWIILVGLRVVSSAICDGQLRYVDLVVNCEDFGSSIALDLQRWGGGNVTYV